MNKAVFTLALLFFVVASHAQSTLFKPFKVDVATGLAVPGGKGTKAGVLLSIEPRYAIHDNVALGFRWQGAVMGRASRDSARNFNSADVKASSSYLATADYYFTTSRFRPFVGTGFGLYRVVAATVDVDGTSVDGGMGTKLGFMPRVGFEAGHFRMSAEYNMVGKSRSVSNNYIGIKLGFFFGGGRTEEAEYDY